jgi:hypothetical protein
VSAAEDSYRAGHRFGNKFLSGVLQMIFVDLCRDVLPDYRVMPRPFVKTFPALAQGFDIEAELTIHALESEGSASKLHTCRDGARICWTISIFSRRTGRFCSSASFSLLWPYSHCDQRPDFLEAGLAPRFPTAILATAAMLSSFLSLVCSLVLDTVTLGRREAKRMRYLQNPAPRRAG